MDWKDLRKYRSRLEELRDVDPYELLGLDSDRSLEAIRAAYRRKIKAYHPDASDPFLKRYNEEVSKLLTVAYQRLLREKDREH